jgi:hypothetical protein|tara:strand:+ start:2063 stop:2299 length:237 start_codon:yes stop_codon:yes gene_type:complete
MTKNSDHSFDLYYLDDYRNLKEDKEVEDEETDRVYVTVVSEDCEITIPKSLWDFMEESGYDPSKIEEFDKFLHELEED